MVKPLQTRRLTLRAPLDRDAPQVAALLGEWDVARMLSRVPYPFTPSHALRFFARTRHNDGFFRRSGRVYMITLRSDPRNLVIGCVGLSRDDPAKDNPVLGSLQPGRAWSLGYWIGKPSWNHGYVAEAAVSAIDALFAERTWFGQPLCTRLWADYYEDNPASGRVLEKLGFRFHEPVARWSTNRAQMMLCRRMVLTREAWQAR